MPARPKSVLCLEDTLERFFEGARRSGVAMKIGENRGIENLLGWRRCRSFSLDVCRQMTMKWKTQVEDTCFDPEVEKMTGDCGWSERRVSRIPLRRKDESDPLEPG